MFDSLPAALGGRLIAFGRGAFCAKMREDVGEGRVSLEVKFEADHRGIIGDGIENREQMIGVEITSLADPYSYWVAKLAAREPALGPSFPTRPTLRMQSHFPASKSALLGITSCLSKS